MYLDKFLTQKKKTVDSNIILAQGWMKQGVMSTPFMTVNTVLTFGELQASMGWGVPLDR